MNMNFKKIIFVSCILIALLGINCCDTKNSKSNSNNESSVSQNGAITTIDLQGKFNDEGAIDAHDFIGENFVQSDPVMIKIKSDSKIIKAEKIVHYYPTIWAGPNDKAIQFIYLYDLEYKDIIPLKIKDGIIEYPLSGMNSKEAFKNYFGKITKQQLHSSIQKVPEMYAKEKTGSYEYRSWKSEKKIWDKIANKYHPGELIDENHEPFEVNADEIELVVTFKGANGLSTKIFYDNASVGN
jgi:hypothetical protein